jgi:F-type H+-transporting ATPase subunit epsilon
LYFELVTLEGRLFAEDVTFISAPAFDGEIGILPRHAPLLTRLRLGLVGVKRYRQDKKKQYFLIYGGYMEVTPSSVMILTNRAIADIELDGQKASEIERQARKDIEEAQRQLRRKAHQDYAKAMLQLTRALRELHAIERIRRH